MPIFLQPQDVALRIALAALAGALIGWNRGHSGRPAGLRTTMLVCLAACIAMLEANYLLPMAGKAPDSFVALDVMRLPLGILSGIGFIGAGAILRRDDLVVGLTTAATLWFITVLGLCFGGGQMTLGITGTLLGLGVLSGLKKVENRMTYDRRAKLTVRVGPGGPSESECKAALRTNISEVKTISMEYAMPGPQCEMKFDVCWKTRSDADPSIFFKPLVERPGLLSVRWEG